MVGRTSPTGRAQVVTAPALLNVKAGRMSFKLVNNGTVAYDRIVVGSDGDEVARSKLVHPSHSAHC